MSLCAIQNQVKKPAWLTKAARKSSKQKAKMWRRFKADQSYNNSVEYKRALNKTTQIYRNAKQSFEMKLSRNIKKDPKSFYSYVHSKIKNQG